MRNHLLRHTRHLCLLRPVAMALVLTLNLLHPFLHQFEGGSLDFMLVQIDLWAVSLVGANVPTETVR